MDELLALPGGDHCAANQVLYNVATRGIEYDLVPQCRRRGIAVMAYSPVGQGRLLRDRTLMQVAKQLQASPAQVAIAWLLARPGVAVIPKAVDPAHVRENRAAADLRLPKTALVALDNAFPPPSRPTPLTML
jgi:diketogulonate reductase-like aldo/keto reductase